ncbi:MAG TPA: hypothetical protein PLG59_13005, partial [bacterium]|nr:hypothetical protein [bacterium]
SSAFSDPPLARLGDLNTGSPVGGNSSVWNIQHNPDTQEVLVYYNHKVARGRITDPTLTFEKKSPNYIGNPSRMTPGTGNNSYFVATNGNQGRELWKTDGTVEGTRMVFDGDPGYGSGVYDSSLRTSSQSPPSVVEDNGYVYFFNRVYSYPGRPGYEAPTTTGWACYLMKADQVGNAESISPPLKDDPAPGNLQKVSGTSGRKLFFTAGDGTNGYELWVTEGTRETTRMVKNINNTKWNSLSADNCYLTTLGNSVYFVANDGTSGGPQLFKSDGTSEGTQLVKKTSSQWKSPLFLTGAGSTLLFMGNDDTHGYELWKSDGTETGTTMVDDRVPGANGSLGGTEWNPANPQITVIKAVPPDPNDPAKDPTKIAYIVWEGEGKGHVEYVDIRTWGRSSDTQDRPAVGELKSVNQTLLFTSGNELWKGDGTETGNSLVYSYPTPSGKNESPHGLTPVGNDLWFVADDGVHGQEVWRSQPPYDSDTTKMAGDLTPTQSASSVPIPAKKDSNYMLDRPVQRRDRMAEDEEEELRHNRIGPGVPGLDGIFAGFLYSTINAAGAASGDDMRLFQLFMSNGTPQGTAPVGDSANPKSPKVSAMSTASARHFKPQQTVSGKTFIDVGEMVSLGNLVYFLADDGEHGMELWCTDGTGSGTFLVKDISGANPPSFSIAGASELIPFQNKLFFRGNDAPSWDVDNPRLWTSDGTAEGTMQLSDQCANPSDFCIVGDTLFFAASDSTHGTELWKTDGTASGTVLVCDIYTDGSESSYPAHLKAFQNSVVFTAFTPATGRELFISDGTGNGTRLVKDISPTGIDYPYTYEGDESGPNELTVANGVLYFSTHSGTEGIELWRSDGTTDGTTMVKDIWPGEGSACPSYLTVSSTGMLYFAASHPDSGRELWKTDGTADGTMIVKDIAPGERSSLPDFMTAYGNEGLLFFTADDGIAGRELWMTDGSAAGTVLVKDIYPGEESSSPWYLKTVYFDAARDFVLFFFANDKETGFEPWCYNPALEGESVGPVWKLY